MTYRVPLGRVWVVRDSEDGVPAPYVSVWEERPVRFEFEGVWWGHSTGDPVRGWIGSLLLHEARALFYTLPDDDRQMVVLDRDPVDMRAAIARLEKRSCK